MNCCPVVAFTFLICMTLLSTADGRPLRQQLRCRCVRTYSGKPIHEDKTQELKIIPAGPHCKTLEIIATTQKGQICLNPNYKWVKSLTKKMAEKKTSDTESMNTVA